MTIDDQKIQAFLEPQIRDFGGRVEIDTGLWTIFAVPTSDKDSQSIARDLLSEVGFAHDAGVSDDDQWELFYVDTANREVAMHWLDDQMRRLHGKIRVASPLQNEHFHELTASNMPHRIAQTLVEQHAREELSAGAINDPMIVRTLLDRLHQQEPLFFAAFKLILSNHLIDLTVLLDQMIDEDVALETQIMRGSISRDPFIQSRQDAASAIRSLMIQFHVINPMDQQRNSNLANPYAALTEVLVEDEMINAHIDGNQVALSRTHLLSAIRTIRKNLYRGEKFETFNTRSPWMNEDLSYPFRFIKNQLEAHREYTPMDWLYMLERAV